MNLTFVAFIGERSANGGVNSLFELVSDLRDHQRTLFVQKETESLDRWRQTNTQVICLESEFASSGGSTAAIRVLDWNRRFAKQLRKIAPDVVVCNDIRAMLYAAPAAKRLGIPVAFFVRDIFEPDRRYGFKWKIAAQLADLVLGLSGEMADELNKRLKPVFPVQRNIDFVYSIVDFDRMQPVDRQRRLELREAAGVDQSEFTILYAAGVCDKKNQLELIRHLPDLFDKIPHAHLHFVGDFQPDHDAYSRQCQQLVRQSGLQGQVTFHGYASKISEWYQLADCTLLASKREGMARCMIESLSCGTPVVSFDVTSAREILEPSDCGRVALQKDYQGLFCHLESIAQDQELRCQMGETGYRISRQLFASKQNSNHFIQLLQKHMRKPAKTSDSIYR